MSYGTTLLLTNVRVKIEGKMQNLFVLHFLVQLKHVQDLHGVAAVSGGVGGLD